MCVVVGLEHGVGVYVSHVVYKSQAYQQGLRVSASMRDTRGRYYNDGRMALLL